MERKTYISPAMKIHALALRDAIQLNGGGSGTPRDEAEAKQASLSFDDEFDSEN